ncbi:syntaxin-18-like [Actinia tenebrosa]|uniref:Syntaxin-18 n=1 Tax=Actinia tenebrosa TaxID=6105 RepID=A0A6P8HFC4_ACTTE|nr:syntaxin-18-like [Actinia tenebrosa]
MDRTVLFKASVKTIRTRNKALGVKDNDKGNSILTSRKSMGTEFGKRAKDVLVNIRKLRDFLMEHRKDYIDAASSLNEMSSMTDAERDQIDKDAETFMRTCNASIQGLKNEASNLGGPEQVKTHRDAVIELLEGYLKVVCKLYSEQRAIRIKRVVDKKRISRLQPDNAKRKSDLLMSGLEQEDDGNTESISEDRQKAFNDFQPPIDEDEELLPDEVQMFEQENKKLFEEMNSLVDEVRQIEGRVVEISRLQDIFSEKVLHQAGQIERIHTTAAATTEDVKTGNEQIREAIKNNASFRVWILFFLVMCSFSLLFLDWYS